MDRRKFTVASTLFAGAATFGTLGSVYAQTPEPASTPPADGTPVAAGEWTSTEDPITVEWDAEIFGEATISGVTGEWCVLRIPDIEHFLSFMIKLEEKYPTDLVAATDFVENDEKLAFPEIEGEVTRVEIAEGESSVGVLYQPGLEYAPDTWSYNEFIPSEDGSHRTIQLVITSRTSKLDREMMESAVSSVKINGEQAVRAMDIAHLFDLVEELPTDVE